MHFADIYQFSPSLLDNEQRYMYVRIADFLKRGKKFSRVGGVPRASLAAGSLVFGILTLLVQAFVKPLCVEQKMG